MSTAILKNTGDWKYFNPRELKCKCRKCDTTGEEMGADLMHPLIVLRGTLGFPFPISSAYRCPEYNREVSTTGLTGSHTTGLAIDIKVGYAEADRLLEVVYGNMLRDADGDRIFTGIGINQKGVGRFIHLDVLNVVKYPRPATWSY